MPEADKGRPQVPKVAAGVGGSLAVSGSMRSHVCAAGIPCTNHGNQCVLVLPVGSVTRVLLAHIIL